jgi:hypothetical protein
MGSSVRLAGWKSAGGRTQYADSYRKAHGVSPAQREAGSKAANPMYVSRIKSSPD